MPIGLLLVSQPFVYINYHLYDNLNGQKSIACAGVLFDRYNLIVRQVFDTSHAFVDAGAVAEVEGRLKHGLLDIPEGVEPAVAIFGAEGGEILHDVIALETELGRFRVEQGTILLDETDDISYGSEHHAFCMVEVLCVKQFFHMIVVYIAQWHEIFLRLMLLHYRYEVVNFTC